MFSKKVIDGLTDSPALLMALWKGGEKEERVL